MQSNQLKRWQMLAIVVWIGILSGFPQILIASLLSLWLQSCGFSKTQITLFGMISFFYALNWLAGPLIDRFTPRPQHRRQFWIVLCWSVMTLSCWTVSWFDPREQLYPLVIGMLIIAFFSALMDVAVDALRIELAPPEHSEWLSLGAAAAVIGWYSGFNLGGALALYGHDYLSAFWGAERAWQETYRCLALMMGVMLILMMILGRYVQEAAAPPCHQGEKESLLMPFYSLFLQHGRGRMLLIIVFVIIFKLGEAFLGRMAILFYREIGFTEAQIAQYAKIVGWGVMVVFVAFGGVLTAKLGAWRGLWIGGVAMASTNLLFAVLAQVGPNEHLLMITVLLDQFTTALANVAFVFYLSSLCDRRYTASQYALLASLGNVSRIVLASSSGFILEHYLNNNWTVFFILTAVVAIPGLLLLFFLRYDSSRNEGTTHDRVSVL